MTTSSKVLIMQHLKTKAFSDISLIGGELAARNPALITAQSKEHLHQKNKSCKNTKLKQKITIFVIYSTGEKTTKHQI